ncbi:complement C4-A-like [Emydura macquarii macquarii]|uniref:complement C4-A-like n=1 Tax=Emydura macquarii macquarii TaxID=1129001 RepID=UPI00352B205D
MERLVFVLGICALLCNANQAPSFLITAPNVVHVGVHETVTIQVHGAQSPVKVTAYFKDEIQNKHLSDRTVFTLNQENNYQEMKKLMIKPDTMPEDMFKKRRKPYVLLVTESKELFKEHTQNVRILLSSKKGYIFIQTDKPIYTPNTKVKYRIFTLDDAMKPANEKIQVSVLNSKGMVVKKLMLQTRPMIRGDFMIPDVAEPGNWKILSWLDGYELFNVSAEFEVKNYELPSFEVKLIPFEPYYHIWNKTFTFDIYAMHSYGKGIDGVAYVRFGIMEETDKKIFLPGLEQQPSIQNGKGTVTLSTKSLEQKLTKNITTLEGHFLYVAVTAVETASGEIQEEELSSVKFVKSPYNIDLSYTKQYFVPGAPFSIVASVTSADGSPAAAVSVTATLTLDGKDPKKKTAPSSKEGLVSFVFNIPDATEKLQMMVKAEEGKPGMESAGTKTTAERYQSATQNYLSISVPHTVIAPGDTLHITLKDIHQSSSSNIDYFYYMVVTKGKVEVMGRAPYSNKIITLDVTEKMVPAFRFIAYYFVENQGHTEIVADSVWLDIVDVCEGKIKLTTDHDQYEPEELVNLSIDTDHAGTIALAVVDTAVFILNRRNKLTVKKVFEAMNSYDLGCSVGGGANSAQVFTDVGLAFISDTIKSAFRKGYKCSHATRRQKRSLDFHKQISGIASKYKNAALRKCCHDGMKLNPMRFSCAKRLRRVTGSEKCKETFKYCCERAHSLRKELAKKKLTSGLARIADIQEEDVFDETSINLRSFFPESWWWETIEVKNPGQQRITKVVPDSITTWEIQAISVSPQKGFCITDPKTFKVFKDFFVSVRLPYSVKRYEQLEVKAVVYNYLSEDLQVTVKMVAVEEVCSAETSKKDVQQKLTVKGNSAVPAYFSLVPMVVGQIPITITASDLISGHSDSVMKNLKVVSEGILRREEETICINDNSRNHILDLKKPSNMIPGSESHVFVSVKGDLMGESIQNCLSLAGIDELIKVPTGCAEQTMVTMAPATYAIEYLDASEQWVNFKPERKAEAHNMIAQGYTRLLEFQKEDGSYGAFKRTPSSTWLTAFIAKVLTRCRKYISVEDHYIHKAVSYLLGKQQTDGSFRDPHPVMDRLMQGGVGKTEEHLALTAFITIAMQETFRAFNDSESSEVKQGIEKAVAYIHGQLSPQLNFYSIAISAYALALVKHHSSEAKWAEQILREISTLNTAKQQRYWGNGEDAVSIEATAYALLQTLCQKDIKYAEPIATWLTEKRKYGGGFCSTQDTVVALEALSQYSIQTLESDPTILNLALGVPGRHKKHYIHLKSNNIQIQEKLKFDLGSKVEVTVTGKGNGTLSIQKIYHSVEAENSTCNDLILRVEMEGNVKYSSALDSEEEDYDYEEDHASEIRRDEPMSQIEWFDIRSRRKRHVPVPGQTESLRYKVCVRSTGPNVPKMSLVDLSLLSGLEPDTTELEQLVKSADQYIDHFEYKEGKVLLYFGQLTNGSEPDCVSFGAKQINAMGLVQPANAIIYDFYNPGRKCSVFYNAPKRSAMLSKLCHGEVCQCAEGPCPKRKMTFNKAMGENTRESFACYRPIVDYAYQVKILGITQKNAFDYHESEIQRILKATGDETIQEGDLRQFLKRSSCELKVEAGKQYLLMGNDGQTFDCNKKMQYLLDSQTWIEEIPDGKTCKATTRRKACALLHDFMNKYETNKCNI